MPTFGDELSRLLRTRDLTALGFAQAVGYKRNGYISLVIAGQRAPSDAIARKWAQQLRLSERETIAFRELAASQRAKRAPRAAPHVEDLEHRLAVTTARVVRLARLTSLLIEKLVSAGVHLDKGLLDAIKQDIEDIEA